MLKNSILCTVYLFLLLQVLLYGQTCCLAEETQPAEAPEIKTLEVKAPEAEAAVSEESTGEKQLKDGENVPPSKIVIKPHLWAPPRISVYTKDLSDYFKYCPDSTTRHQYTRPNFKGQKVNCAYNSKDQAQDDSLTMSREKELRKNIIPNITSAYAARTLVRPTRDTFKVPKFHDGSICANFKIPHQHHTDGVAGTDILLYVAAGPMQTNETDTDLWVERCPTGERDPMVLVMNVNPRKLTNNSKMAERAVQEIEKALGTSPCTEQRALIVNTKGKEGDKNIHTGCVSVKCTDDNKDIQIRNAGENAEWKSCTSKRFDLSSNPSMKILCPDATEMCSSTEEKKVDIPLSTDLQPMRISISTILLEEEDFYCPANLSNLSNSTPIQRTNMDRLYVPCGRNNDTNKSDAFTTEKKENITKEIIPHVMSVYKDAPLIHWLQTPITLPNGNNSVCYAPAKEREKGITDVKNNDFVLYVASAPFRPRDRKLSVWARPCSKHDGRVLSAEINFNPAMIMVNKSMKDIARQLIANITGTSECPKDNAVMLPAKMLNGSPTTVCLSIRCDVNKKVFVKFNDSDREWKDCDATRSYALKSSLKYFHCPKYNEVCTQVEISPEVDDFVKKEIQKEEPKKETVEQQATDHVAPQPPQNNDSHATGYSETHTEQIAANEVSDTSSDDHKETSDVRDVESGAHSDERVSDTKEVTPEPTQEKVNQDEVALEEEEEEEEEEVEEEEIEEEESVCGTSGGVCVKGYPKEDLHAFSWRIGEPRIKVSTLDLYNSKKKCPETVNKMLYLRPNFRGGEEYCIGQYQEHLDPLTENKTDALINNILPEVTKMIANKTLIRRLHNVAVVPHFGQESPCFHFSIPMSHQQHGLGETDIFFYVAAGPMSENESTKSLWAERCPTNEGEPIVVAINFNPRKITTNKNITRFAFKVISKALGISTCDEGKPLLLWKRPAVELPDSAQTCVHVTCEEASQELVQRHGETEWKMCARRTGIRAPDAGSADPELCEPVRGVCLNSHSNVVRIPFSPNLNTLRIEPSFEDLEYLDKQCPEEGNNVNVTKRILDGVHVQCGKDTDEDKSDILTEKKDDTLRKEIVTSLITMLQSSLLLHRRRTALRIPKFETGSMCSRFHVPKAHRTVGLTGTDVVLYVAASPFPLHDKDVPVLAEACADINGRTVAVAANFNPARIMDTDRTLDAAYMAISKALGTMNCLNNAGVMLRGEKNGSSLPTMSCVNLKCEEKGEVYLRGNETDKWQKCSTNQTVHLLDNSLTLGCPNYNDVCSIPESGSLEPTPDYDPEEDAAIIDVGEIEEDSERSKVEGIANGGPAKNVDNALSGTADDKNATDAKIVQNVFSVKIENVQKTGIEGKPDKTTSNFKIRLSVPESTPETQNESMVPMNRTASAVTSTQKKARNEMENSTKVSLTIQQSVSSGINLTQRDNKKESPNETKSFIIDVHDNRTTDEVDFMAKNNESLTLANAPHENDTNSTDVTKNHDVPSAEEHDAMKTKKVQQIPSKVVNGTIHNKVSDKVNEIIENVASPDGTPITASQGEAVDRQGALKHARMFLGDENAMDKSYLEYNIQTLSVFTVIIAVLVTL